MGKSIKCMASDSEELADLGAVWSTWRCQRALVQVRIPGPLFFPFLLVVVAPSYSRSHGGLGSRACLPCERARGLMSRGPLFFGLPTLTADREPSPRDRRGASEESQHRSRVRACCVGQSVCKHALQRLTLDFSRRHLVRVCGHAGPTCHSARV